MKISEAFKSIVDDLDQEICLVDLDHVIRYMNRESIKRYEHRGGKNLIGQSLFGCHNENSRKLIQKYVDMLLQDENLHEVLIGYNPRRNETNFMIAVRDEDGRLIGYYERHDKGDVTGND